MSFKDQVVFDIAEEKFKYLNRENKNLRNRVDIVELNKRLNQTKKINFYNNAKIVTASILLLALVAMISLKV
jgi:hypothetical protein|tara:strand:- start:492 stop:707 length:216 start_codon:yes stop_codon:yes gene_type:complete